jgi:hypothetical protein
VRGVAIEIREINVTRILYKSGQTRDTKTHDDSVLGTEGVEIMLKKNPQQKVWVAIDLPFVSGQVVLPVHRGPLLQEINVTIVIN